MFRGRAWSLTPVCGRSAQPALTLVRPEPIRGGVRDHDFHLAAARRSAFLAPLPAALQDLVLERAVVRTVDPGETLFLQGETAESVHIVLDGWVKLYRVAPSGAEAVVSVMTKGRSFGEAVALRQVPYPVSAESITEATLIQIKGAQLRSQIQNDPKLAIAVVSSTYMHLQSLITQVEQLKARSGVQRVAEFLADLADCDEGGCKVTLPYNKTLIAGRLGMKPESLSRAFARLRDHGVRIDANIVRIEDLAELRDLAADLHGKP